MSKLVGIVVLIIITPVLLAWAGIVTARAVLLPEGPCVVTKETAEGLGLEISYARVKAALGCDGALQSERLFGDIRMETFHWRGDAWPFGRLEGVFYNGVMHKKTVLWLTLYASLPKRD